MYHIAIVEDEKEFRDQLQIYLKQYGKENQISFQISVFEDGADILEKYKNEYDICKYVSFEEQINHSKEYYYQALYESSQKWHEIHKQPRFLREKEDTV